MIIAQNPISTVISRPEYIAENHWQEWLDSGVKPSVIADNIYTETDARELDEVLNRNNRRKWKHSDKLVPAWIVRGVDPEVGEISLLGVQAKPDKPDTKNGKIQKYLGANEYGSSPLFLKCEDYDYWLKIIQDLQIPIIITEGAKKAACLLSNGYAAISIPGVSTCRKKGRLHKLVQRFCGFGRLFYLCFDNDITTKRPVQLALEGLARDLTATGSKVMVISLPEGDVKGVDDYIVANSPQAFSQLVAHAQTIEEWKEDNDLSWAAKQEQIKKRKRSKLARAIETIQTAWGGLLKWNELTQCPELGDEELPIDELKVKIALELDMDVQKDDSVTSIKYLSRQRSYHPIREYLQDVAESHKDVDLSILDNLSTELFGNDSEICNIYMKKFLIGSVARIMKPGTKMDNAVILHGVEGIRKSTFWSVLFNQQWFSDSMDDSNVKDEKMLIHQYWCLEWSEFSTVYKRKDVEALKKFLAQSEDSFRKPYDRAISKHKRGCVFVGTTNSPEVLQDATGRNRRFWIIDVNQEIDIAKLEEMRDKLWAAAYYCYQRGEIHYIKERSREASLQDKENEKFKVSHPWMDCIEAYLVGKNQTYLGELFDCLQIEPGRREARHQRTIRDCLELLGWESTEERGYGKNGSRPRLWRKKKNKKNDSDFNGGVDHNPQNNVTDNVTGCPPTVPPTDPPKNSFYQNNGTASNPGCPPTDPPTDPPKNTPEKQLDIFQQKTDPPTDPPPVPVQSVGSPKDIQGKGFQPTDPPSHQKVEIKKEKISLHPSFDKNKNREMKIEGITGNWEVKYSADGHHIHIEYVSPNNQRGSQTEFIQIRERLTYKHFREQVEAAIWELERGLIGDRQFRVKVFSRDMNDLEPKWIPNCTLVSVPNPPARTYFKFQSANDDFISKFGLDEFELME